MLDKFDPSQGSFDTYVTTALYWPIKNERDKAARRKEQLISNPDEHAAIDDTIDLKERVDSYSAYIKRNAGVNVSIALQTLHMKLMGESVGYTGMIIYNVMLKNYLSEESA
jgi:hypothetical protein